MGSTRTGPHPTFHNLKHAACLDAYPTAGNPIYEAQKGDFLKRKVADLRQLWRNMRKKKLRNAAACADAK